MRSNTLMALALGATFAVAAVPAEAGWLSFPFGCTDPDCEVKTGPYTPGIMAMPLDHSMVENPLNGFFQYGTKAQGTADGIIVVFNGERLEGELVSDICISGTLKLYQTADDPASSLLSSSSGSICEGFIDERPSYEYNAPLGIDIKAAAAGTVLKLGPDGQICLLSNIRSCESMSMIGIDHGNGFITQYGRLADVLVKPGDKVEQGQVIAISGNRLRFEVLKAISDDLSQDITKRYVCLLYTSPSPRD